MAEPVVSVRCDLCGGSSSSWTALVEAGETVWLCNTCYGDFQATASRIEAEHYLMDLLGRGPLGVRLVEGAGI